MWAAVCDFTACSCETKDHGEYAGWTDKADVLQDCEDGGWVRIEDDDDPLAIGLLVCPCHGHPDVTWCEECDRQRLGVKDYNGVELCNKCAKEAGLISPPAIEPKLSEEHGTDRTSPSKSE